MPEINGCTRAQTVVDALRHVVLQLVLYRSAPDQKQLLLPFGRQLHYYIMAIYYWECVYVFVRIAILLLGKCVGVW